MITMRVFYNIAMYLMGFGLWLGSQFDPKLRLGYRGRKDIFRRMSAEIDPAAPLAWFHAASLGEFEQGRPVIEAFRQRRPNYKILVTFFSPSGYEIRKNYGGADHIFYLPMDTPGNVRRFMRAANPDIAVFIKYEFWVNYLLALGRGGTRTFIISTIFRPSQRFFKWYGGLFRRALRVFEHLFVQDEPSKELLASIGITAVSVAGDTRFDRVYDIARNAKTLPAIEDFAGLGKVFIAGSTWPADEELLLKLINDHDDTKFIIAPHEIDPERIEHMRSQIQRRSLRYTRLTAGGTTTGDDQAGSNTPADDPAAGDLPSAQVLFVDTIGILSSVYRYGRWAYIGGGFGVGIHNTLEAATFGLPLAFGPNYGKFREARNLIALGGAESISDYSGLEHWFRAMKSDVAAYEKSSRACSQYVDAQRGATLLILDEICK